MMPKSYSRGTRGWLAQVTLAVGLLVSEAGHAEAQSDTTTERELKAHRHFRRALEFADQQAYPEALVELERARAAAPHYALLYNIGQVYSALGDPKKAIEALSEYLAQGGDSLPPERQREVRAALALLRARLGTLELTVQPSDAVLYVDGERMGAAAPSTAFELGAGVHHLLLHRQGYASAERQVALRGGERIALDVTLEPASAPPGLGQLVVFCPVPDVTLTVDASRIPLRARASSLMLAPGPHHLRFERQGYVSHSVVVHPRNGAIVKASCSLTPRRNLPDGMSAELSIRSNYADARIEVDAQPAHGSRWPVGRHNVSVTRFGCEPWERTVTLMAGARSTLSVHLEPTEALRRERSALASERKNWAYGVGAGALVVGGAAVVLAVLAGQKTDAYLAEQRELDQLLFSGRGTEAMTARQQANDERFDDARVLELTAVGLGAGAVVGAAAATVLYFLGRNAERDAEPPRRVVASSPCGWSLAW
jgi:tetratricopeptide (TPR) repeat protein